VVNKRASSITHRRSAARQSSLNTYRSFYIPDDSPHKRLRSCVACDVVKQRMRREIFCNCDRAERSGGEQSGDDEDNRRRQCSQRTARRRRVHLLHSVARWTRNGAISTRHRRRENANQSRVSSLGQSSIEGSTDTPTALAPKSTAPRSDMTLPTTAQRRHQSTNTLKYIRLTN